MKIGPQSIEPASSPLSEYQVSGIEQDGHASNGQNPHHGRVKIGSLKSKVGPPPDSFLAPLSDDELRDWGAL